MAIDEWFRSHAFATSDNWNKSVQYFIFFLLFFFLDDIVLLFQEDPVNEEAIYLYRFFYGIHANNNLDSQVTLDLISLE